MSRHFRALLAIRPKPLVARHHPVSMADRRLLFLCQNAHLLFEQLSAGAVPLALHLDAGLVIDSRAPAPVPSETMAGVVGPAGFTAISRQTAAVACRGCHGCADRPPPRLGPSRVGIFDGEIQIQGMALTVQAMAILLLGLRFEIPSTAALKPVTDGSKRFQSRPCSSSAAGRIG